MTYTKDDFRQIFQQPFNAMEWQQVLLHFFQATELKAEPEHTAGTTDEECGYYLGNINTAENYLIGLFYYKIQHGSVARKRVGLRNLVKSLVHPTRGDFDAALVVFDSGSQWRLSFICDMKGESTAPKRYTYVFGESDNYYNTPVSRFDTLQRKGISFANIMEAFSVESLNKDFFNQYKAQYKKFCDFLHDDPEMCQSFKSFLNQGKAIRDYVKKMMGRIVFLYFVQRKGWLNGDSRYMSNMFSQSSDDVKADFLDRVLEPMFFGLLNTTQEQRKVNAQSNGWDLSLIPGWQNIPYLNGGLFEQDEIDKCKSVFPTAYFEELFEFFDAYNFTIDENDPDDSEVGIDPEMLGHIFENLLEDNKDKGAFYTPKEIVQYMCRESVIQYLKTHEPDERFAEAIEHLIRDGEVDKVLQDKATARKFTTWLAEVKVCDPAIGSGAFPMGVLNVLYHSRQLLYGFTKENHSFSPSEVKREIIQNNIYGVDIEQGAVDIARLRFWLSLVVDEIEPQPLPNLDYKIVCGNSLLSTFDNRYIDVRTKTVNDAGYVTRSCVSSISNSKDALQAEQNRFYSLNGEEKYRSSIAIKKHILDIIWSQLDYERTSYLEKTMMQLDAFENPVKSNKSHRVPSFTSERQAILDKCEALKKELNDTSKSLKERSEIVLPFFDWEIIFSDIFDRSKEKKGFDIVIGNPPYFVYEGNNKDELPILRKQEVFKIAIGGKLNAYKLFLAHALQKLLKQNGINCFIFQNSFLADLQAANLRNHILNNYQILRIDSYPERDSKKKRVFESVKMSVCIFLARYSAPQHPFVLNIWNDKYKSSGITTHFTKEEIVEIDPISFTIPRLKEEAKPIILKMIGKRSITIKCWEGELNITSHRSFFSTDSSLPIIMKGAGIQKYYYTFDMSQGQIEYLKEQEYLEKCGHSEKALHHKEARIVMQGMTGANDKIRLVMCIVPKGMYLGHSCKYILPSENISQKCLLGFLNSKLANFFFRCFSTNSNVNGYEIEAIPICAIPEKIAVQIEGLVETIMAKKNDNHLANIVKEENKIDNLVYHLYGLTYDEVLIVAPETPITREEYESYNH